MSLQDFRERLKKIEDEIDEMDVNELEERVYILEEDISNELEMTDPDEAQPFLSLLKKIKHIKKENDFYDQEAELDRMFPNRHDDDFDEDSMSYDSVFGTD